MQEVSSAMKADYIAKTMVVGCGNRYLCIVKIGREGFGGILDFRSEILDFRFVGWLVCLLEWIMYNFQFLLLTSCF